MKIFELDIPKLKYSNLFKAITKQIATKSWTSSQLICTPNPEICLQTLQDKDFLQILQSADYLTNDGIGLYIAYQILDNNHGKFLNFCHFPIYFLNIFLRKQMLYKKYGDRICGSNLTDDLVNFCEQKGVHIAILEPYFPKDAAKCDAQENFTTNLQIVFPYLHFEMYIYKEGEKEKILKKIAQSQARIVFTTLGMKKQEMAAMDVLKSCPNIRLGLGVGSSFDYFIGFQKRAPQFCQSVGLEWFYRIFTSPNRIQRLKRIHQAVIVFPLKILSYKK